MVGSQAGRAVYEMLPSAAAFQYASYLAAILFLAIAVVVIFAHDVPGPGKEKVDIRALMREVDV